VSDDLDHVSFEGAVTDASANHIVNARVIARQINTGNERSTNTDQDGRYRLQLWRQEFTNSAPSPKGFQTARAEKTEAIAGSDHSTRFYAQPPSLSKRRSILTLAPIRRSSTSLVQLSAGL
jgi:hypothetical protein